MKRIVFAVILTSLLEIPSFAQPKIVAHRGYWRTEGSAQNSLTSLLKADEIGCYGSELDVWLTPDGVPVVFHDSKWEGTKIEDTPYPQMQFRQLSNGEFLPTLPQYLQMAKKLPETKLILEIKPHSTQERDDKVTEIVVRLVKQLDMEKQVEYISFSRRVCQRLHELVPEAKNAYLNGELSPAEAQKQLGCNGVDYHLDVFAKHSEWLEEAARCGMEVNVWTVDGEEKLREHVQRKGIHLITTNDPLLLKTIIQGK